MKPRKQRNPRAIDGFVPRRRGDVPGSNGRRRTLNDFESVRTKEAVAFESTEQKLDDDVQIEASDLEGMNISKKDRKNAKKSEKKRRFFIFKRKKDWKKWKDMTRKEKIKRVALILGILLMLVGGFLGWKFFYNTSRIFDGNIFGFLDSTRLKGEDEGRVNILLAGTSEGDPGHQGADLTDSIMLVSLDTENFTAFTVSIPRDLWVEYGYACSSGYAGKINVAYQCGKDLEFNEAGYPKGGMGLLSKVVSENFGLPVHYYGKINYKAFEQAVNSVGGITIDLKTDDSRGILDRIFDWECNYQCYKVRYPNGELKLNGEQALDLARARGDATGYPTYGTGGDFGRTNRQRDMLVALKDKALSTNTIFNPAKISGLLDAAGNNVKTNFKTNELRRLYDLSKKYENDKITSIDLSDEEVNLVTTDMYAGQSIVLPVAGLSDFSEIQTYFDRITSNNPVVRENASVVVLNGTGEVGLAQTRAEELEKRKVNVVSVGNASNRKTTVIIDKTKGKKPETVALLKQILGGTSTQDASTYNVDGYAADIVVIVGSQKPSTSTN